MPTDRAVISSKIPSARVREKNGSACEAHLRQAYTKEGKMHDQVIYAMIR
jgi:hypothetical protein